MDFALLFPANKLNGRAYLTECLVSLQHLRSKKEDIVHCAGGMSECMMHEMY